MTYQHQYDAAQRQLGRLETRAYAPHVSVAITALAHAVLAVAEALNHSNREETHDHTR